MIGIQFLGHSFFRLNFKDKKNKTSILIDPFLEQGIKGFERKINAPIKLKQLKDIDLILVTHENFDHFEKNTIEELIKRENAIIAAHDSILSKVNAKDSSKKSINANKPFVFNGITIEAFRVHYHNSFYPLGFKLTHKKSSVIHLGDTLLTTSFSKLKCDALLIPIGGRLTMDIIDAARAAKMIKPKIIIPMHYNTFDAIKVKPKEFKERIDNSNIESRVVILKPKESIKI